MSSGSLERLFEQDTKSRWKIIVISALVTAAVGMIAELDGNSLEHAEAIAMVAGGVFFLAGVVIYMFHHR